MDHPLGARAGRGAGLLRRGRESQLDAASLHGYGIAKHIEQTSNGVLRVEQGSLYPALERLLKRGWVTARWDRSPTGRRARYYTITKSGCRRLAKKAADYERVVEAITRVMSEA